MRKLLNKVRRPAAVFLLLALLLTMMTSPVLANTQITSSLGSNEVPFETYTYWKGLSNAEKSPSFTKPVYDVKTVISSASLGLPLFEEIGDICTDENGYVYILDSGAAKIYIVDSNYNYVRTIENFVYNGEALTIAGASGIFEYNGSIYIADTKGNRVLAMDLNGAVYASIGVPVSHLIPDDFNYSPQKVAVDSKGYMYVSCDGSYYGALVFSPTLEFLGFYGANTVPVTVLGALSNLIERLFSNDIKKGASTLALPYQFVDMVVGPNDFIYTATGRQSTGNIMTGQVSVMNPGGKNVLSDSGEWNFADIEVGVYNTKSMTQNIMGIDVDADGFFYIVDATYGRVFWYDEESNLLGIFGGTLGASTQQGTTRLAEGITLNGRDVLVYDGSKNVVNVFGITEYGEMLRTAQIETLKDNYEEAMGMWQDILDRDQNNQLAYRGLAKGYYALGENQKAAEYARLGADRETYANAFEKLRTAALEKWFALIFIGIVLLVAALILFSVMKKKKQWKLIKNEKLLVMLRAVAHPFESFRLVKEKHMGSVTIAAVLLIIYYIVTAIMDVAQGYAFNYFNAAEYNSFFVLLSTVGLVALWTVANWLVCVLLGGIGKLKEIFIVTCYSLIPMIFSQLLTLVLSHFVTPDEFVFVTILNTACALYTFFMLIVGIMKVHDFEFGRFMLTTILSLISMLIIVFLIFLVILLAQQVFSWLMTIYIEIRYR